MIATPAEATVSDDHSIDHATRIVGIGEALFDCFADRTMLGGAPVNFAVHAHQLVARRGGRGVVVSRVGSDSLGERLVKELDARGLVTEYIQQDSEFPTGTVKVLLCENGQPSYEIVERVAWDDLEFQPSLERLAAGCTAVCFGTLAQRSAPSRATIERFLALAGGAIRLFDVNLRQGFYSAEVINASLRSATAVKLSEEELTTIGGLLAVGNSSIAANELAQQLCEWFELELVALTRGAKGTVIYARGKRFEAEPARFPHQPGADSVGAGDACCAGVLYGLLARWPPEQTLELANRLGAYVASQPGATLTLPRELLP